MNNGRYGSQDEKNAVVEIESNLQVILSSWERNGRQSYYAE